LSPPPESKSQKASASTTAEQPQFEDITTKTIGLRFPRPYRTF
jgi:hypothetical protein